MSDNALTESETLRPVPWSQAIESPELPAHARLRQEYRQAVQDLIDQHEDLTLTDARRTVAITHDVSLKTVERYTRGMGIKVLNTGTPLTYDFAIVTEILKRLAEGETMESICSDESMPSVTTVWEWRGKIPELDKAITRARKMGAASMVDRAIDVAEAATSKEQAYCARVASDALFRAAGMWDEQFRDKYQGVSGGVQLTINTNLDVREDPNRIIAVSKDPDTGPESTG